MARTKTCKEEVARANLRNQGIEAYVPRFRNAFRRLQTFEDNLVPLFPGYIFFRSNQDPALWRAIGGTRGISYVLWGSGREPRPVPDDFMKTLFASYDCGAPKRDVGNLKADMSVNINRGPFAEIEAIVSKLGPARRVSILLNAMGGANFCINVVDVEPLR